MASTELELKSAALNMSGFGQNGGMLVTDTTAHTGAWRLMIVLSTAVFTTLTTEYTANDTTTAAVAADFGTLYTGTQIAGKITAVTLTSGSVLLIK